MKNHKLKKIILVLLALPLTGNLVYAANAPANNNQSSASQNLVPVNKTPAGLSNDKVVLNFENADIQSVIKAISQLSGKNFVIDPRVKGTVNIVSDQPISKSQSYKVLEAALRMQGFACVEADGVIKVLPETDAKTYGMQTITTKSGGTRPQLGDQVITKIFVLQHGSATQLSNSLRPLIAPNNSIAVYPNSNALIITDYASNLNRIGKIINQLSSVENNPQPVVLVLKNAVASDVAQILQSYQNGGGSGGQGGGGGGAADGPSATITVEPQNNSIIIYSPIQDKVDELKALALRIDQSTGANNSDLHVVYLRNADAGHVADVLRVIANGQEDPDLTASSASSKFLSEPVSVLSGSSSSGGSGGSGAAAAPTTKSTPGRTPGGTNGASAKDAPKIIIQAEPTTNSLIIQAPLAVYKNLRMIIDMLDVRRAQVMIEAMIADIDTTKGGTFGIQWLAGAGNQNLGVIGLGNYGGTSNGTNQSLTGLAGTIISGGAAANGAGGQTGGASALAGIANLPNQLEIGLVTGTVNVGGTNIPTIGALANAIVSDNVGTVLSRPTLITLDNEQARIFVGSNIPLPSGSFTNSAGASGTQTTVSRQDLGTALQIKPLITQSGAIQLDIYEEDSQLDQSTINDTNGATYTKRNLRSTVLADDGQIIALGGLTGDTLSYQKSGIPLLSSIPYLGWLFSWQSRSETKSTLVLFLRPVIIKNAQGLDALSNQRYNYVVDQQRAIQYKGNIMLPNIKSATLDQSDANNLDATQSMQEIQSQGVPLNLNKNLPIVDLTAGGKNIGNSTPGAINVSTQTAQITPLNESSSVKPSITPVNLPESAK